MTTPPRPPQVAEMQGLYGPFHFPERLLQKLWLLGFFDREHLRTADGRALAVLAPGRWNLLGGPDFRGARLVIDGREVAGDVEVHFRADDWFHHGHDRDPAYDGVVLHVVLYEPGAGRRPPVTRSGREIAQLALLPHLHCNLEEFAADDALEAVTQRVGSHLTADLLALEPAARRARLGAAALLRWRQKVHFASIRIARLGWDEACHHTALEVLGYRFNRAAMLTVAGRFPLAAWRRGPDLAAVWSAAGFAWQTQGVRPANHPRRRLEQYRAWTAAAPDWPARLRRWAEPARADGAAADPAGVAAARRRLGFRAWRDRLARDLTGAAPAGGRFDTLVTNGFLPLLAAATGESLHDRWFCWFPGEVPDRLRMALRAAGVGGTARDPWHEGILQGAIQLTLEQTTSGS